MTKLGPKKSTSYSTKGYLTLAEMESFVIWVKSSAGLFATTRYIKEKKEGNYTQIIKFFIMGVSFYDAS